MALADKLLKEATPTTKNESSKKLSLTVKESEYKKLDELSKATGLSVNQLALLAFKEAGYFSVQIPSTDGQINP